jgi:hypothetical protein
MSKDEVVRSVRSDFATFPDEAKNEKILPKLGSEVIYAEVRMRVATGGDLGNGLPVGSEGYRRLLGRDIYVLGGTGAVEHHTAGITLPWEDVGKYLLEKRLYVVDPPGYWRSEAVMVKNPVDKTQ